MKKLLLGCLLSLAVCPSAFAVDEPSSSGTQPRPSLDELYRQAEADSQSLIYRTSGLAYEQFSKLVPDDPCYRDFNSGEMLDKYKVCVYDIFNNLKEKYKYK